MRRELNDKQERFIHEYLKDQNANAAAVRAGYSGGTKGAQARLLMRHPLIHERIQEALADMYAALDITAYKLLQQQARIAFFDPRKLFDKQGNPVPLDELDEAAAACLAVNYKQGINGNWTQQVRQLPRMQALAMLDKRYAQFMEMSMAPLNADGEDAEEISQAEELGEEAPAEEAAAPALPQAADAAASGTGAQPSAQDAPRPPRRAPLPAAKPAPPRPGLFQRLFGDAAGQAAPRTRTKAHPARRRAGATAQSRNFP